MNNKSSLAFSYPSYGVCSFLLNTKEKGSTQEFMKRQLSSLNPRMRYMLGREKLD